MAPGRSERPGAAPEYSVMPSVPYPPPPIFLLQTARRPLTGRGRRGVLTVGRGRDLVACGPWRVGFRQDACRAPSGRLVRCVRHEIDGAARGTVALMPHEMTAVLTLLLALVSAIGMLWIALRLERVAAGKRADNLYESMRGLRDHVRELRRVVEERLPPPPGE